MNREWWRDAVVYQIYPRSFQDSDDDGIGDLEGLIGRLDYLNDGTERSLGVDAIWLSPTFPSPMADFGYDVSDYNDVDPDFGSLETMDRLIEECHKRGMKVLLDWVPNHTSDQHPWFVESRSSTDNSKRDWYFWRAPGAAGERPNNWRSVFGGPAWTLDEDTGEYYLHSFLREQPDLNWRNSEVEATMHDVLRFWFDRGVDGFRIDVMGMIIKEPALADNPQNPDWKPGDRERSSQIWVNNRNYPEVYDAVKRIRTVFDEYPARMAVGEVFGTAEEICRYYGDEQEPGLHLAFNFQFIHETEPWHTPWEAEALRRVVRNAEAAIPAGSQPCYALANHDRSRFVSRHNADGRGLERARASMVMLVGLRNTPFVYYGEEIGMEDADIADDRLCDPARIRTVGRDPERTPMQWDESPGRGFSSVEPWLPYGRIDRNVAAQTADPDSMLALCRRAIWLRKRSLALLKGDYREMDSPSGVYAFRRALEGQSATVVINTSLDEVSIHGVTGTVWLSTTLSEENREVDGTLKLGPLAAAIVADTRPPGPFPGMTDGRRVPLDAAGLPVRKADVIPEVDPECDCPRLDKEDWDGVESDWSDVAFVHAKTNAFMGIPIGYDGTRQGLRKKAEAAGATVPEDAMLLNGSGKFRRPVMLEVETAAEGRDIFRAGGIAYTRLFEAPWGELPKVAERTRKEAAEKYGRWPDDTWVWYLTCRQCSRARNFETLIVAHFRKKT